MVGWMLLGKLATCNTITEENTGSCRCQLLQREQLDQAQNARFFLITSQTSSNCFPNSWSSRRSTLIKIHFWLKFLERQDSHLLGKNPKKSPFRFVCVLRKIPLNSLKAETKTPVLLFLTPTVKAYSSRNQAQNNQYKKSLQSGKYCRLMVWWDIYSQVDYLLFKNKTGSKEVQFEKLANDCVVHWSFWKTVCLGLEIPQTSQCRSYCQSNYHSLYAGSKSYFLCFV